MTPQIDQAERMKIIAARINSGKDSYAGRLDAWHTLGDVSGRFQTLQEIQSAAKADFEVIKLQLTIHGRPVEAYGTFRVDKAIPKGLENQVIEVNGQYITFLGAVGKDYTVIHHSAGGELLDRLVGQIEGAHYETMGTLDFGRVVWCQIDPNVNIRVGDDVSDILLTFHTSHDGSRAWEIYETAVRIVCKNTLRTGSLKRLAATLRVRHTKNSQSRIASLTSEINEIQSVAMSLQDRLSFLAGRRVQRENLDTIMRRLFPMTLNDDGVEQSSTRRDNILTDILARYEYNDGDAFPEQRGTAYSVLNSVVEYVDHMRSSKADGRAESAVFGSGDRLKSQALELILAEAENMPLMRNVQPGIIVDFAEAGLNVPGAR